MWAYRPQGPAPFHSLPIPYALVTTLYFYDFGFFSFHIQVITYSTCLFLCVIYFTKHNVLRVHLCCQKWQDVLLSHG